jgi:hypothetical protein
VAGDSFGFGTGLAFNDHGSMSVTTTSWPLPHPLSERRVLRFSSSTVVQP